MKQPDRASPTAPLPIRPHRMDFKFRDVPRHWFRQDPVLTHFLNALSLTFPDGERFFVDAVRAWRDQASDADMQQAISGFIGQEAMHSREHDVFNRMLAEQGYAEPAAGGQKLARVLIGQARERLNRHQQLAATVALEHITAILAHRLLSDPQWLAQMDASVRPLWMWHAIEEIEHKSVAWDLYQAIGGGYRQRSRTMVLATLALASYTGRYTLAFLRQDQLHRSPTVIARGLWRLAGPRGFLTRCAVDYLRFFQPGFHPWKQDNRHLVQRWRRELDALTPTQEAAA